MKIFFLYILLFFIPDPSFAQPSSDSLKHLLSKAEEDSGKINQSLYLSSKYTWSYPDSSLLYSLQGLKLAEQLNNEKLQVQFLVISAEAFSGKGNFAEGLESAFRALEMSKELKDSGLIALCNLSLASVYYKSGDYQKSLNYNFIAKANPHVSEYYSPEVVIGIIGRTYFSLNKLDSSLFYIQKAYNLELQNKLNWPVPYFYMAAILGQKKQYKEALNFYRSGSEISVESLDKIDGYNGMAGIYKKMGQTDSAIIYAKKAITEVQVTSFIQGIIKASEMLTNIYTEKQLIDSAFKYQGILVAAKDSLFSKEKISQFQNISYNEQQHQQELAATKLKYKNRLRIYILIGSLLALFLVAGGLFRNNRNKQKAYILLVKQKKEIDIQKKKVEQTLEELKSTQKQLIQSEKMASLGELTAGIAHEIQNPLNFVNNFSEVNKEMLEELKVERLKPKAERDEQTEDEIINDVIGNSEKINHHGKRAGDIVKGMLQHSRSSTGVKEPTNINALADEYLRLAYHGLRAKDKSFNADMKTDFDENIPKINIVAQDVGRVILNLITNAFYAVKTAKSQKGNNYEPTVWVSTKKESEKILVMVKDNGTGIPDSVKDKIFHPFFTTKPTGEGTGLGLSLSYDIIKAHGGQIKVESKEGAGTEFTVEIPVV